jgi:hypothetical protein
MEWRKETIKPAKGHSYHSLLGHVRRQPDKRFPDCRQKTSPDIFGTSAS